MIDYKQRAGEAWGWIRSWPLWAQGFLLVVIVFAVLALTGKLQSTYSHARDWLFDRRAQAAEAERDTARAERDAAIKRAEAAEAQAAVWEQAAAAQKTIAEDKGTTAREKAAAAEEIQNETEDAVSRAGADPARARDEYRDALKRLGYLPR